MQVFPAAYNDSVPSQDNLQQLALRSPQLQVLPRGRLTPTVNTERCLLPLSTSAQQGLRGWKLHPHTPVWSSHSLLTAQQVPAAWQFSSRSYTEAHPSSKFRVKPLLARGEIPQTHLTWRSCITKLLGISLHVTYYASKGQVTKNADRPGPHFSIFQPSLWNNLIKTLKEILLSTGQYNFACCLELNLLWLKC